MTAPTLVVPAPLDTWILPFFAIHAQLDDESDDPYPILHLIIRFPVTMTVRTPVIVNTVDPAGQVIVRSPLTARILWLPLTAYRSISATDDIVPADPPVSTGSGIGRVVVPTVLEFVVDVYQMVVPRKSLKTSRVLINISIARFDDDPTDDTTAPDTRTGSFTRSTPVSVKRPMVPSLPVTLPKNALLRVGHTVVAASPGLY